MVWDSIKNRPLWLRCTVGVLAAVLAAAIRLQFLEVLGLRAAFLTFYPAVAVAALYGGFSVGLLVTVVSAALADYFWMEPVGQFAITNSADLISIVIFLASGVLISYLAETAHRTQERTKAIEVQAKLAVEQEFHSFVKEVGDYAIFMLDTSGGVVSWNKGAEQIKGYQADEIIGRHLSCFYTPEDNAREWPGQLLHRVASEGRVEDEGWRVRKDGSRFWANVVLTAVHDRDGSLQGFSKITRDITERNQAEAALQESQDRLAVELAAIKRLYQIGTRFVSNGELGKVLQEVIDAAIAITGSDMGNLQLLDNSGELKIIAHRGFEQPSLDFFNSVHEGQTACGTALMLCQRVIIEDVAESAVFTGSPAREAVLASGARAVQSTPICSRSGHLLGMLSTHYKTPRRPDERDLLFIDMLSQQIADMLERKRMEEGLLTSEERLRLAKAAAKFGIQDYNVQTGEIRWDQLTRELWGLGADLPINYEVFSSGLHPDDRELVQAAIDKSLVPMGDNWNQAGYRVISRSDGVTRWVGATWQTFFEKGRAVRMVGTVQDITERKRMEEEQARLFALARLHNAETEAVFEAINDAVLIYDTSMNVHRVNSTFIPTYGFDPVGLNVRDVIQRTQCRWSDGRPFRFEEQPTPRAMRGETVLNQQFLITRSDGVEVALETSSGPLRIGDNIKGTVTVWHDVTERKRMEEELRKSRDELELRVRERTTELSAANENLREQAALLDLAHDAILVRDMDNNILYWNDGAEKTYGWAKEDVLGKAAYTLLHTQFPKPLEELMAVLLKNGGEWEGELGHRTKNGQQIVVASRWAIQKDPEGNPIGMLEINRDITERKRAEEQIKSYMAKLEQSNQALQDFASIAAHDMKEPLRKVIAFGNMLRQKSGESLGQSGNDYLNRMINATERMQSLLAGLLDYSRVATASEPFKDVDLSYLIGEVLSDLEVRIVKTGGEVQVGDLPVSFSRSHTDAAAIPKPHRQCAEIPQTGREADGPGTLRTQY